MSYDTYRMIFQLGRVGAIVFLVLTVMFFFIFRIPRIVGLLSGRTARKAIASIQQDTRQNGYHGTPNSIGRNAKNQVSHMQTAGMVMRTEKISTQPLSPNSYATVGATEVLIQGNETEVLSFGNETEVLYQQGGAETANARDYMFEIEKEILFIHTEEQI